MKATIGVCYTDIESAEDFSFLAGLLLKINPDFGMRRLRISFLPWFFEAIWFVVAGMEHADGCVSALKLGF